MSLTCRKEKGLSNLENTSGNGNGYVINNKKRVKTHYKNVEKHSRCQQH